MKKPYLILFIAALLLCTLRGLANDNPSISNQSFLSSGPIPNLSNPTNTWCNQLHGTWEGIEKINGLHHCVYKAKGTIQSLGNHYRLSLALERSEGSHHYCPYTHDHTLTLVCSNNLIYIRNEQVILDGHLNMNPSQNIQLYVQGSIANNKASILLTREQ